MHHIKLLMQCHAYLRGTTINTTISTSSGPQPIDRDQLARDIANYINHIGSHAEGCWAWGPEHYVCAYERVKELQEKLLADTAKS